MNVNGGTIYADATEEDMYAAIDGLIDKLDRRVRKHKEKASWTITPETSRKETIRLKK